VDFHLASGASITLGAGPRLALETRLRV